MGAAASSLRASAPPHLRTSAPPRLRSSKHPQTADMAPSATRRAAELKFSPCGEQFGCIEAAGSLCLWRFQSGTDVPLPFSRLQCHGKRGADLCFVGTSVVVATVGQSVGLTAPSLCLWDMLLPPSQALITSCAAHSEGGCCVLHSPSDMSLISGRSMVTSASALACSGPYPCGDLPLQRPIHLLRAAPLGPRGAPSPLSWMHGEAAAEPWCLPEVAACICV